MKTNLMKTTIFLSAGIFALALFQPMVYGQIPLRTKAPVTPSRQPSPTPTPMRAPANPSRQSLPAATRLPSKPTTAPASPKALPLPKATKLQPDLYIKDVKLNTHDNSGSVLIANHGPGTAAEFKMVYDLLSESGSIFKTLTTTVAGLPSGNERWVTIGTSAYSGLSGPFRANKIRFALIAPYAESRVDNNQLSKVVPKPPMPDYFPAEIKSEYRIIQVRVENRGVTVVKPGTEVTVTLGIVFQKDGRTLFTQCVGVDVLGRPAVGKPTTCYSAKTSVTAPIKPGQSGWAVANFALMGSEFDKIHGVLEEILEEYAAAKTNVSPTTVSGLVAHVAGGNKTFVTTLSNNFYFK